MNNQRSQTPQLPQLQLILVAMLACSVTLNVVQLFSGSCSEEHAPTAAASLAEQAPEQAPEAAAEATANAADPQVDQVEDSAGAAAPVQLEAAPAAPTLGEWKSLAARVEQSLARTFQNAAGEDGDALSSVYARLFVWDLDLRRDLQAGDTIAVVWRKGPDGFPAIGAASFHSQKLGRTLTAFPWKATGDTYSSYWRLDGTEVPMRLKDGPITQYEQITSLLKDRPTHKGMDFKTPVGTEITAPGAGTVTRVNWNWTYNGNCIEIRLDDGVLAKFLHLSENRVAAGARVSSGQVIALSGNTGHSTAPHLHYQLDKGTKTVDPLDYHGTIRRQLGADDVAALQQDSAAMQQTLSQAAIQ